MTFSFNPTTGIAEGPEGSVQLSIQEAAILACVANAPGQIVYWGEIEKAMYGRGSAPFGIIAVRLVRLRKRLASIGMPACINTVHRRGLRWVGP